MKENFVIKKGAVGQAGLYFSQDSTFPAFEVPTLLDMKNILVDLLHQCDKLAATDAVRERRAPG